MKRWLAFVAVMVGMLSGCGVPRDGVLSDEAISELATVFEPCEPLISDGYGIPDSAMSPSGESWISFYLASDDLESLQGCLFKQDGDRSVGSIAVYRLSAEGRSPVSSIDSEPMLGLLTRAIPNTPSEVGVEAKIRLDEWLRSGSYLRVDWSFRRDPEQLKREIRPYHQWYR